MIIVSFTTLPSRISYIFPIIENICVKQTIKPDKLILYIPNVLYRTNQEYIIPDDIIELQNKFDIFEIRRCEDYGPITKLLPATNDFKNPNDIIITIDDDVLLEIHAIEELLDSHNNYPNSIIGFIGIDENNQYLHSEYLFNYSYQERLIYKVSLLGGYRSILFPRNLILDSFHKSIIDINNLHKQNNYLFHMLDDDYFLHKYFNKINMIVCGTKYPHKLDKIYDLSLLNFKFMQYNNNDALNDNNNTQNNLTLSRNLINNFFNNV
jgi:hypothetical protein